MSQTTSIPWSILQNTHMVLISLVPRPIFLHDCEIKSGSGLGKKDFSPWLRIKSGSGLGTRPGVITYSKVD